MSATRTPPALVEVGRILRPHGVRGELLVEVYSEVEERFEPGSVLLVVDGSGAERGSLHVIGSRPHRGGLLVSFEEVWDRDQAAELRDSLLAVRRDQVPSPPEDSYYYFDLVGCRCQDRHLGSLGDVLDVVEDGGGLLLKVGDSRRQLLIPFVRAYLRDIDVERGEIELEIPPGLLEACEFKS